MVDRTIAGARPSATFGGSPSGPSPNDPSSGSGSRGFFDALCLRSIRAGSDQESDALAGFIGGCFWLVMAVDAMLFFQLAVVLRSEDGNEAFLEVQGFLAYAPLLALTLIVTWLALVIFLVQSYESIGRQTNRQLSFSTATLGAGLLVPWVNIVVAMLAFVDLWPFDRVGGYGRLGQPVASRHRGHSRLLPMAWLGLTFLVELLWLWYFTLSGPDAEIAAVGLTLLLMVTTSIWAVLGKQTVQRLAEQRSWRHLWKTRRWLEPEVQDGR